MASGIPLPPTLYALSLRQVARLFAIIINALQREPRYLKYRKVVLC